MIHAKQEEYAKAVGVQQSERAREAERILGGSGNRAKAKVSGRLRQQRLERDHSTERKISCKMQKEHLGRRTFEKWSRDYHASTQQIFGSVRCAPCNRDAVAIMRDIR